MKRQSAPKGHVPWGSGIPGVWMTCQFAGPTEAWILRCSGHWPSLEPACLDGEGDWQERAQCWRVLGHSWNRGRLDVLDKYNQSLRWRPTRNYWPTRRSEWCTPGSIPPDPLIDPPSVSGAPLRSSCWLPNQRSKCQGKGGHRHHGRQRCFPQGRAQGHVVFSVRKAIIWTPYCCLPSC